MTLLHHIFQMTLIEKLRETPAVAQKEVEMNTLDIQIRGLTARLNYYRLSLTETASFHSNLFVFNKKMQSITA